MTAVIEDVFTVIGSVNQCTHSAGSLDSVHHFGQQTVGVTNSVIVSINERAPIGNFCLAGFIGFEIRQTTGITLLIFKMRPIGV